MPAHDRTGVGPHRLNPKDEWRTPDSLYDRLNQRWEFDYDPASSHENHKPTPLYSTLEGTFLNGLLFSPEDGLAQTWAGLRVFVNPPFSQVARWVAKMDAERERAAVIVAILPEARETRWWQEHVLRKAIAVPMTPRPRFIHGPIECGPRCTTAKPEGLGHALNEPMSSPPNTVSVVEFRPDWLMP